jgi:hypothetical protein
LAVTCALQLLAIYFLAQLRINYTINSWKLEKIPAEVVDYAYSHFLQGKTENQVKRELAKKGWRDPLNQQEVIFAVLSMYGKTNVRQV